MQTMMFVEYVVCLSLYVDQRHESQIKKSTICFMPDIVLYTFKKKKKYLKLTLKKL